MPYSRPAAYLNYLLVDKDYKVLDAGWQLAPATTFTKQKLSFPTKTIKEAGYLYAWLSYDNSSANWVYFDDFKVTHTKSNVIQYNEYYPFGLQASTSWTRENNSNNFLYNEGNELNQTSGWYEMFFRGYDPTLGRMLQIDPYATMFASYSPFNYAVNNPVLMNDPNGGQSQVHAGDEEKTIDGVSDWGVSRMNEIASYNSYMSDWANDDGGGWVEYVTGGWVQYNRVLKDENGNITEQEEDYFYVWEATSSFSVWEGGEQGDPNEYQIINDKYFEEFMNKYIYNIEASFGATSSVGYKTKVAYLLTLGGINNSRDANGNYLELVDKDGDYRNLMLVGYEVSTSSLGKDTNNLFEIIQKEAWQNPVYGNPGFLNTATGIATQYVFPTLDGAVSVRLYFQFVPLN